MNNSPIIFKPLWNFKIALVSCIYLALNLILFPLITVLYLLLLPFKKARFRAISHTLRLSLNFLFLKFIPAIDGYKIEFFGLQNAEFPAIFTANHITLLDAFLLLSVLPNTGVIIKKKYTNIFIIKMLCVVFDFISVDDADTSSNKRAMQRAESVLKEGRSLLIFPEATRSPNGKVGDFHSAAFRLSKKLGVKINPVCIYSTMEFFSKKALIPKCPTKYFIEFLPVLAPDNFKDYQTMLASCQRLISKSFSCLKKDKSK